MTPAEKAKALVHRFEMESMALHKIQREWLEREIAKLLSQGRGTEAVKPLPGELALIQIAMETLRHIATYSPVSRIQPVMIARDAMKKIEALTFESQPVGIAAALPPRLTPSISRPHLSTPEKPNG